MFLAQLMQCGTCGHAAAQLSRRAALLVTCAGLCEWQVTHAEGSRRVAHVTHAGMAALLGMRLGCGVRVASGLCSSPPMLYGCMTGMSTPALCGQCRLLQLIESAGAGLDVVCTWIMQSAWGGGGGLFGRSCNMLRHHPVIVEHIISTWSSMQLGFEASDKSSMQHVCMCCAGGLPWRSDVVRGSCLLVLKEWNGLGWRAECAGGVRMQEGKTSHVGCQPARHMHCMMWRRLHVLTRSLLHSERLLHA